MHLNELNTYLQEEYYTLEQMADVTGVTTDRIIELAEKSLRKNGQRITWKEPIQSPSRWREPTPGRWSI